MYIVFETASDERGKLAWTAHIERIEPGSDILSMIPPNIDALYIFRTYGAAQAKYTALKEENNSL